MKRFGKAVTTSLAIAEGTENEHASVIKLVRTYQADLEEFGLVRFEIRPRPEGQHGGAVVEFATLNEQQSTLLLTYMRNSDIVRRFKKALVKAFFELMQQAAKPAINPANLTRLQLIEMAMQAEQERLQLESKVGELAPKAEALDRIADAEGTMNPTVAAKNLQVQPKQLFDWMRQHGWIYRRPGSSRVTGLASG